MSPDESQTEAGADSDAAGEDLRDSLAGLSRLGSSRLGLTDLLTKVAGYAVQAIPGADGAGLTLLEPDRSNTVVATADFVSEIDAIQYDMGQGPCISAASTAETVISGSLGSDRRWPRFGGRIARLGVHSVVSLPLVTPDGVVGAMNVYARSKNVFDDAAAELGEIFAVPAAIAVQNAHVLAQAQRLTARLESALHTRGVIDQAVGIVMSRTGGTADEALERLRTLSQHEHQSWSSSSPAGSSTKRCEAFRAVAANRVELRPVGWRRSQLTVRLRQWSARRPPRRCRRICLASPMSYRTRSEGYRVPDLQSVARRRRALVGGSGVAACLGFALLAVDDGHHDLLRACGW